MSTCVFLRVVITELWEGLMKLKVKLTGAVSAIALSLTAVVAHADVLFWSTQAKPVEEAQAMRDQVLAGANMAI